MNNVDRSSSFIFDWIFLILTGNKLTHNISDGFEIQQDPTRDLTYEFPALECLEKSP